MKTLHGKRQDDVMVISWGNFLFKKNPIKLRNSLPSSNNSLNKSLICKLFPHISKLLFKHISLFFHHLLSEENFHHIGNFFFIFHNEDINKWMLMPLVRENIYQKLLLQTWLRRWEQHEDIKLPIPINESSTHMYF